MAPGASTAAARGEVAAGRRRLTYYMLLRIVVTSLLMVVAFVTELVQPVPSPLSSSSGQSATLLYVLIGASYAFTLGATLLIRRGKDPSWLAPAQAAADVATVACVVWATGAGDSGFVFLFLLVIVGVASVLPGVELAIVTIGCVLAYAVVVLGVRTGLLPPAPGQAIAVGPVGTLARTLSVNLVAFVATAALARRLVGDLERAGARIEAQGTRLEDLSALHGEVVDSLTSGLFTVAPDGRVASCNAAAMEILALPSERIVGRDVRELLPGLPEVGPRQKLRRAELAVPFADGSERAIGVSVSPLVARGGAAIGRVLNFQDVTELRRMRRQVERAERLAAIGRLAAGVAHEIRNPLAAMSGSIELLRQMLPEDAEGRELMGIVIREIERLDGLIRELLAFARPAPPQPTVLELGATVRELVRVAVRDPKLDGHALDVAADAPVWTSADPGQLRQVLWNLVRNAVEASPPGAAVTVATAEVAEGERRWAQVAVRDRGPGIGAEDRVRIFEPFFSTKQGGTGLGLAVVHRIVEEHQGRIEVRAADGGGTEFVVLLVPCDPPPAGPGVPSGGA